MLIMRAENHLAVIFIQVSVLWVTFMQYVHAADMQISGSTCFYSPVVGQITRCFILSVLR